MGGFGGFWRQHAWGSAVVLRRLASPEGQSCWSAPCFVFLTPSGHGHGMGASLTLLHVQSCPCCKVLGWATRVKSSSRVSACAMQPIAAAPSAVALLSTCCCAPHACKMHLFDLSAIRSRSSLLCCGCAGDVMRERIVLLNQGFVSHLLDDELGFIDPRTYDHDKFALGTADGLQVSCSCAASALSLVP